MHTTYTFKKNGKAYSAKANNRFEAQEQIGSALRAPPSKRFTSSE